jgi:predicted CXXCH cytochrome family protein
VNTEIRGLRRLDLFGFAMLLVGAAFVLLTTTAAFAQESSEDPFWDNATCYQCHQQSGLSVDLPSGETLNLAVFEGDYDDSVHNASGIACRNCHEDITGFPHPELTVSSLADFTDQLSGSCEICHRDHYTKLADEIHASTGGLVCSNCHDPHATGTMSSVTAEVQPACTSCHAEGVAIPAEGVHASPEVQERQESTGGLTILLFVGGMLAAFVFFVWLVTVAWRAVRNKT